MGEYAVVRINRRPKIAARHWLRSLGNIFGDAVFPPKCLVCHRLFRPAKRRPEINPAEATVTETSDSSVESHRLLATLCCWDCVNALVAISEPFCTCCGMMFKPPHEGNHLCGDCIMQPKKFRMARAALVYDRQLMAIIHRFKYAGKNQLARPLGGLMLSAYLRYWHAEAVDLILPVPLHSQKLRRRGFNQSYLLMNSWKAISSAIPRRLFNRPVKTDVLIRSKATVPQTDLGRRQRLKNIKGAFSVRLPEEINGKKVLLVDDVYTTGATVNECARSLLKAGASLVDALTLARAI